MLKKSFLLFCLVFCLTGCSKESPAHSQALHLRTRLMESPCSFTAHMTADYEEHSYSFTVEVKYAENAVDLTIVEPQELSGITATVDAQGGKLTYDGMELGLGKLAGGNLAPMAGPWLLLQCWQGAYISAAGSDGDLEKITYLHGYEDKQVMVDTWLTNEGVPVRAEMYYDGDRCLIVDIENYKQE